MNKSKLTILKEKRGIQAAPPAAAPAPSSGADVLDLLTKLKTLGYVVTKDTPSSTTPTPGQLHGPLQDGSGNLGPFTTPGIRPQMYSALSRPRSFIHMLLPASKSNVVNEKLSILSGQTTESGDNADGWCEDGPLPGYLKKCDKTIEFGDFNARTGLNALPEIGQIYDRADTPREILNAGPQANPLIPDLMFDMSDTLDQLRVEFFKFGVAMERSLERVAVTGNHANAGANRRWGWITEFHGLEQFIGDDYDCESAYSIVETFNSNDIGDTVGGGDTRDFSEVLHDLVYAAGDRADQVGMSPSWYFVGRKELFRMATYELACNYAVMRCRNNWSANLVEMGPEQRKLQADMMRGQYLLIDEVAYPFVFSDGVTRTPTADDTYTSDLFFVPDSWAGRKLTRLEYFPMDNQYATAYANFQGEDVAVINNGMYMIGNKQTPFCKEYHLAARMRLILETPFLAGRIDDISVTWRAQTRDPFPGDSLYVNGGDSFESTRQ